jgi:heme-degrading monooxygenase HmoA
MQIVISHAWTWDAEHADAYVAKSAAFNEFLESRPGFVSRTLIRDVADPCHLMNLRVWRSVADYEAIIGLSDYRAHIDDLSQHVDPARYEGGYVRLYADVVTTTEDAWRTSS